MDYKDYEVIVGLEVHAELSTESKIYCSCRNKFGVEVNTECCPICMGMPGTLPSSGVCRQNGTCPQLYHP